MSKVMKELLVPTDFSVCPVWRYDEDSEGYFEVRNSDDLEKASSTADLLIHTEFITPGGHRLMGHVTGVQQIYVIGLFANDEIILVNRNMRDRSREQSMRFIASSGLADQLSLENMFPLSFETRWGGEFFKNFLGVFTLS